MGAPDTLGPAKVALAPSRRFPGWAGVLLASGLHFILFVLLLVFSFSSALADFDPPAEGTTRRNLQVEAAFRAVSRPLFPMLLRVGPTGGPLARPLSWLIVFANSLIWGCALWLPIELILRVPTRRKKRS